MRQTVPSYSTSPHDVDFCPSTSALFHESACDHFTRPVSIIRRNRVTVANTAKVEGCS